MHQLHTPSTSKNGQALKADIVSAGHVHIDRIKVEGPLAHTPLGEIIYKAVPDSEEDVYPVGAEAYKPQAKRNPQPDDIYVKSTKLQASGDAFGLVLECCPPQQLQGHNVFGSQDLAGYTSELFRRQIVRHKLSASEEDLQAWETGSSVKLTMIHLVANFACEPSDKPLIFDAVDRNNSGGKHRESDTWLTLGFTPRRRSTYHTATLYDKYALLASLWRDAGEQRQYLLHLMNGAIRLEIKIYAQWLRTYGVLPDGTIVNRLTLAKQDPAAARAAMSLQYVLNWKYVDLDALYFELLKSYRITNAVQRHLTQDEEQMLSTGERRAYLLWLQGFDLTGLYRSRSTVWKYVRAVRDKTGVDISSRTRPKAVQALDLEQLFTPKNILSVPDWLKAAGRYWERDALT